MVRLGHQQPGHSQRFFLGLFDDDCRQTLSIGLLFGMSVGSVMTASWMQNGGTIFPAFPINPWRLPIFHPLCPAVLPTT